MAALSVSTAIVGVATGAAVAGTAVGVAAVAVVIVASALGAGMFDAVHAASKTTNGAQNNSRITLIRVYCSNTTVAIEWGGRLIRQRLPLSTKTVPDVPPVKVSKAPVEE